MGFPVSENRGTHFGILFHFGGIAGKYWVCLAARTESTQLENARSYALVPCQIHHRGMQQIRVEELLMCTQRSMFHQQVAIFVLFAIHGLEEYLWKVSCRPM